MSKKTIHDEARGRDIHDGKERAFAKQRPIQLSLFQTFLPEDDNGLPTAFPKKWTCDLPMNRAWSGRCGFEADLNRFALIPQVHRTQPCYYLHQQAVIRSR